MRWPRFALILIALATLFASLALVAPSVAHAEPAAGTGDSGSVSSAAPLTDDVRALATGSGPDAEAEAVEKYWTPERMAAAEPADVTAPSDPASTGEAPAADGTAGQVDPVGTADTNPNAFDPDLPASHPVAKTYGKVFFTLIDNQGRHLGKVCSGTIVNSVRRDMVWTAGHCVHGGHHPDLGPTWHYNWTFAPAYKDENRPYGTWAASTFATRTRWANNADFTEDIGVAVIAPVGGHKIQDVVGAGQGLKWNFPPTYFAIALGYPVEDHFATNKRLLGCFGNTVHTSHNIITIRSCNLSGGASGGGWLRDISGGLGYLNGVNSTADRPNWTRISSPYYGSNVGSLYYYVVNEV